MTVAMASRESAEAKGRRYLIEGRLTVEHVDPDAVRASCRGGGTIYNVAWAPSQGWDCTCPAKTRCSHIVAAQLVVTVRGNG